MQISATNWLKVSLIKNLFNTSDNIVVCIAVLLPMQQLNTTKMMMLMFSVIVMCSHLCSVCLVCRVLKDTYFKEHLSVVASKYSICNTKNNAWKLKLCSMFKHSPNWKGMVYVPNGIFPLVFNPNGKCMVLWKMPFRSGNGHGKK